jgi:hypothetical protein
MENRQGPTIFLLVLGLVATDVAANGKGGGAGGCGLGGAGHSCSSGMGLQFCFWFWLWSRLWFCTGLSSGVGSHWGIPNSVGFGRSNGLSYVDQTVAVQQPPPWNTIGHVKPFLFSGADYIGPSGYSTYVQTFTWPEKPDRHSPVTTALTNSAPKDKSFQNRSEHKRK